MLALKKGCAWVRVAPVPASPLLTTAGATIFLLCRDGTRNGLTSPNKELAV
jgi:hypothetical protein